MAEEILVERKITDGDKFIRQLLGVGIDVTAASWVQEDDSDLWYFYIASKLVDEIGKHEGYRAIGQELRKVPGLSIDPFEIKLIGTTELAAKEMLAFSKGDAAHFYSRQRVNLGGLRGGDAYVYPQMVPA